MHVEQGLLPRRIVVKVGTSTLTRDTGSLNLHNMDHLARVLSDLKGMGHEIVLVSSAPSPSAPGSCVWSSARTSCGGSRPWPLWASA